MGRTKPGNRFQGHFQGQARQLTSSAFGRAILWAAKSAASSSPKHKNCGVVAFIAPAFAFLRTIMLDVIYIGLAVFVFAALALYARGCEKL